MIRRGTAARLGIRQPTWVTERDLVECDRSELPAKVAAMHAQDALRERQRGNRPGWSARYSQAGLGWLP